MALRLDYLFIGAHPDDCEIMAGGTLLKLIAMGKKVGILDLSQGELGSNGSKYTRKREVAAVAKIAKFAMRKALNLKDGGIDSSIQNLKKVIQQIRLYSPEVIFTFKKDNRHPDHSATHELVKRASFLSGLKNYLPKTKSYHRPSALLYFGEPYYLHNRPNFFIDVSRYYSNKIRMIECYSSQVKVVNNKTTKHSTSTLLGSELFWNALKGREQWYGALIGAKYAEGFWCDSPLQLFDPINNLIKSVK